MPTTKWTTAPRGAAAAGPQRRRGPMTALARVERRETFTRPVSDPGGATRPEIWAACSADDLWSYHRIDDEGTPWLIVYRPTGQQVVPYGTLAAAREATAGGLLDELRRRAYLAAFHGEDTKSRADGQRWLAVHMRGAGTTYGADPDWRCRCGGYLLEATGDGRLAHVDCCRECYTPGAGLVGDTCVVAPDHRFCGDPQPIECGHHRDNRCQAPARPNDGAGCGKAGDVDCCGVCCWGR